MTLTKNILSVIVAIVASCVVFNMAEAADRPFIVECYSGGEVVLKGLTHDINYPDSHTYSFRDLSGEKFEVPKAMCIINFGRDS